MSNGFTLGNGNASNTNGWVKAIATVGLPSVIAVVLTLFLIWNVTNVQKVMAEDLVRIDKKVEQLNQIEVLIRIGRQTCINTAPDAVARLRCLE